MLERKIIIILGFSKTTVDSWGGLKKTKNRREIKPDAVSSQDLNTRGSIAQSGQVEDDLSKKQKFSKRRARAT